TYAGGAAESLRIVSGPAARRGDAPVRGGDGDRAGGAARIWAGGDKPDHLERRRGGAGCLSLSHPPHSAARGRRVRRAASVRRLRHAGAHAARRHGGAHHCAAAGPDASEGGGGVDGSRIPLTPPWYSPSSPPTSDT